MLWSDAASASASLGLEGVGDEVSASGPFGVDAVPPSTLAARLESADWSAVGNSLPRFSARRKIPAAALGLKKNLSGTRSNSTSANDEDASPPLGHSEVSAVQHSPGEVVKPDVAQRADHDGEISSTLGTEQAGDVLNNDPSAWANKLICDSGELEEQAGSLPGESCSLAGDGDVLTWESSAEEINSAGGDAIPSPLPTLNEGETSSLMPLSKLSVAMDARYVLEAGDSGPVLGEDASAPGVPFALEDDSHSCLLKSEVDTSDA